MSAALDVLKGAREILSDPEKWTTHVSAQNGLGDPVPPLSANAVCWCAVGAIQKVAGERDDNDTIYDLVFDAIQAVETRPIYIVNDFEGREATLAVFDKAIERLS